jgi:hypothetical protein
LPFREFPFRAERASAAGRGIFKVSVKSILTCAAMLALATTAAEAAEDRNSANFWLPHCKAFVANTGSNLSAQGVCAGIIEGAAFASPVVCVPDPVTRSQAVEPENTRG